MFRYFLLTTCCVLLLGVGEVRSQRVPGFSQRPRISPYLFNNRTGGASNYFQFVRPMQQQVRTNQLQTVENNFLQQQILGNQGFGGGPPPGALPFGQQQGMLRQPILGIGQQSVSATYFNYSHYYYNSPVNIQQQQPVGRRFR
jgi:hypothetical protein